MIEPQLLVRQFNKQLGNTGSVNDPNNPNQADFSEFSMDLALILNYYNFLYLGYSYKPQITNSNRYIYNNFGSSIMAAIRFNETYQLSFSWDIRRDGINENTRQFEIGLRAYLFGEYLFSE